MNFNQLLVLNLFTFSRLPLQFALVTATLASEELQQRNRERRNNAEKCGF